MIGNVFMPESLAGLWGVLDGAPDTLLCAGGTDLLVKLRSGVVPHAGSRNLACLERIEELKGISEDENRVFIGAATVLAQVQAHPAVREHFPVLTRAIGVLGSPQIRTMGTLGGNICTASPAGDTLPPLYVLDAELELRSAKGARTVPVAQFISGPGRTVLKPGEILFRVVLNKTGRWNLQHFEKVSARKALSIAVASLAVAARITDGGTVDTIRCAWGSVGPTVVVSRAVENVLAGRSLTEERLLEAAALISGSCAPIDDIRASAEYRRVVAGNLLLRLQDYPKPW